MGKRKLKKGPHTNLNVLNQIKNLNINKYNQSVYKLFYFFDLGFLLNSQLPADLPPPPLIL